MEMGGAAAGRRGESRGTARKKSGETVLAEDDQRAPGARDMRETKRDERHSASELLDGGILTEAAGLTFGLEQAENVISLDCRCEKKKLALIHAGEKIPILWPGISRCHYVPPLSVMPVMRDGKKPVSHTWALNVTDDAARGVVHELDADLGDSTTGT